MTRKKLSVPVILKEKIIFCLTLIQVKGMCTNIRTNCYGNACPLFDLTRAGRACYPHTIEEAAKEFLQKHADEIDIQDVYEYLY